MAFNDFLDGPTISLPLNKSYLQIMKVDVLIFSFPGDVHSILYHHMSSHLLREYCSHSSTINFLIFALVLVDLFIDYFFVSNYS